MKLLTFIVTLLTSINSISCDRPYEFKVGAFFNSASVVEFWSEFAQELTIKTKCPVNLIPSPTFEAYIKDLIEMKGDIFMVPSYYAYTLTKYGYIPLIETVTPTKTYLITLKKYNPNNLTTLTGKTIHVASKFSGSYAITKLRLDEKNMFEKVTFKFGNSFQLNAMNVIKGEADAAVLFSPVFDSLPKTIQNKVNVAVLMENDVTGFAVVKPNTPEALIKAIRNSHDKINMLKWTATVKPVSKNRIDDTFQMQFDKINQDMINQATSH